MDKDVRRDPAADYRYLLPGRDLLRIGGELDAHVKKVLPGREYVSLTLQIPQDRPAPHHANLPRP